MVVLIVLTVVSLRSTQITGRDDQRSTDVQTITQQLEGYYSQSGGNFGSAGEYPPLDAIATEADIKTAMPDLDPDTLRAPNIPDADPVSLIAATDNDPQTPTVSQYIYQPLQSDGELCGSAGDECRRFFLYYRLESEPGVVKKIISKNQ
jgi:hypothetical protein